MHWFGCLLRMSYQHTKRIALHGGEREARFGSRRLLCVQFNSQMVWIASAVWLLTPALHHAVPYMHACGLINCCAVTKTETKTT